MIDSRNFKGREIRSHSEFNNHENPNVPFPYEKSSESAKEVTMGLYNFGGNIIEQLGREFVTYEFPLNSECSF